jgi:Spy/CpxP family protein refolding chaperone
MRHRARAGLLAARLGITDEQKAAFAQAREATAKVREDARASLRALRLEARKGEPTEATRAALREKVASIRASAREAVAPEARKLLASVTPEQRARWAEAAARRGRTLDDEAILRRIERRLLGPGGRGHGQHRHGPRPR